MTGDTAPTPFEPVPGPSSTTSATPRVMPVQSARRRMAVPALARWLFGIGIGIAATLAANVAHGLGHGLVGAAVAAWPAVALVGKVADCAIFARFCRARFGC